MKEQRRLVVETPGHRTSEWPQDATVDHDGMTSVSGLLLRVAIASALVLAMFFAVTQATLHWLG
jgi:hypothetical protein